MHVRLKEKGQVTIPSALRAKIDADIGDLFEVALEGGNIVLRPQQISAKQTAKNKSKLKGVDIGKWIGAGKGHFKTPEDVDAFMRDERDQWV